MFIFVLIDIYLFLFLRTTVILKQAWWYDDYDKCLSKNGEGKASVSEQKKKGKGKKKKKVSPAR